MADDLTLGEVARMVERENAHTRTDLAEAVEAIRDEIKGLVRVDVHSAEHAALIARVATEEGARERLEQEVRSAIQAAQTRRRDRVMGIVVPVALAVPADVIAVVALLHH